VDRIGDVGHKSLLQGLAGNGPAWSQTDTRGSVGSRWQRQRVFTDGLGRIAMTKTQAEPGCALTDDGSGGAVLADTSPEPRWIGTGRTVHNNKVLPVESSTRSGAWS
jgi:hypothetical protein